MSLAAAILTTALASSPSAPPICAGCTLDAAAHDGAMPLLVVLRDERDAAAANAAVRAWRTPALGAGFAVLQLAGWERGEPSWIEDQVFAAARQQPIDLARVYLVGAGDGAAYIARHVQAVSETFAAVVITSGGGAPATAACPDQVLPAYFSVDADDPGARALRSYLERCKQPVVWSAAPGPLERKAATAILDWLRRHVRVTTVALSETTPR